MEIIDGHVHVGVTEKIKKGYKNFSELAASLRQRGLWMGGALVMPNVSNLMSAEDLNEAFTRDFLHYDKVAQSNPDSFGGRLRGGGFFPFLLMSLDNENIFKFTGDVDTDAGQLPSGLKYHPSLYQTEVDDACFNSFFSEIIAFYDLPLLVHCGRDKKSHISHLINAAKKWKNTIFIAAHMGGNASDLSEQAIDLIAESKLDNIYVDTSACKLPWLIEMAVDKMGDERIIFGSDEPYADFEMCKYCVELANIPDKSKERIFHENIKSIMLPH